VIFYISLHLSTMFAISLCRSKLMIWTASFALLFLHRFAQSQNVMDFNFIPERDYVLEVVIGWLHLRCLSFSLEDRSGRNKMSTLFLYIEYCLYLPLFFFGPILIFPRFEKCIQNENSSNTSDNIRRFAREFAKYTIWILIINCIILRHLHFNAIQVRPHIIEEMPFIALCGVQFCIGLFFMLKYYVLYGLFGAFARLEAIEAPSPPDCVAVIYRYSEMWKTFDKGLYAFLIRYIYVPCCAWTGDGNRSKVTAALLTFLFAFVWHGTMIHVFVWSLLNFIGVAIELIIKEVMAKKASISALEQRLETIVTSMLLLISLLANAFFCSGAEVGMAVTKRTLLSEGIATTLFTVFVMYSACQVTKIIKMVGNGCSKC